MTRNYISFDIETAKIIPGQVRDLKAHRPLGIACDAKGMHLRGKSSAVAQHMAPQFWADGKTDEVLDYVSQDVRATLKLAHASEQQRELLWIAHSGKVRDMKLRSGWWTVDAAMRLPEPDTS